jgi:ABC-type Zn2+ transport system substrate-binding protein/surface adhesin
LDLFKKTADPDHTAAKICELEKQIADIENIHQNQIESLYMKLSEREKQYHDSLEKYNTQLKSLEEKHAAELAEVKKIYQEEQV